MWSTLGKTSRFNHRLSITTLDEDTHNSLYEYVHIRHISPAENLDLLHYLGHAPGRRGAGINLAGIHCLQRVEYPISLIPHGKIHEPDNDRVPFKHSAPESFTL